MTRFTATVNRWNHNREFVSLRMEAGVIRRSTFDPTPPHILAHIGHGGDEQHGDDATAMLDAMIKFGHAFEVFTTFVDVSPADLRAAQRAAERWPGTH